MIKKHKTNYKDLDMNIKNIKVTININIKEINNVHYLFSTRFFLKNKTPKTNNITLK